MNAKSDTLAQKVSIKDSFPKPKADRLQTQILDTLNANFQDGEFIDITLFSDEFIIDMKYAEKDNLLDSVLYPCAKCMLRYEVLKDLLKAQTAFKKLGYKMKIWDCYRPLSV